MLADTGGDFAYYKKIYNRFFAFIYGWSLFAVIQTAAIASLAYVFAQSLHSMVNLPEVFPSLSTISIGGIFSPFAELNVKLVAIMLILALTFVNILGLKEGAGVSKAVLITVFAGIFVILVFGLKNSHATLPEIFSFKTVSGQAMTISSFFTAMLAAFLAYQGWVTVGFIGGEVS